MAEIGQFASSSQVVVPLQMLGKLLKLPKRSGLGHCKGLQTSELDSWEGKG